MSRPEREAFERPRHDHGFVARAHRASQRGAVSVSQLRLLSRLALERAETFIVPRSKAEASREIRRLLSRKRDHGSKRKKVRPGLR